MRYGNVDEGLVTEEASSGCGGYDAFGTEQTTEAASFDTGFAKAEASSCGEYDAYDASLIAKYEADSGCNLSQAVAKEETASGCGVTAFRRALIEVNEAIS